LIDAPLTGRSATAARGYPVRDLYKKTIDEICAPMAKGLGHSRDYSIGDLVGYSDLGAVAPARYRLIVFVGPIGRSIKRKKPPVIRER
jgi:hypothetical protein